MESWERKLPAGDVQQGGELLSGVGIKQSEQDVKAFKGSHKCDRSDQSSGTIMGFLPLPPNIDQMHECMLIHHHPDGYLHSNKHSLTHSRPKVFV